ncbi:MAG: 50S ribosomal protein L11 methyltransferase [Candidatus Kapabacteria bacterium]|nr:50S ribosomal protein L11 methyltransferase [Candidatus Kapabacteria bacterium]
MAQQYFTNVFLSLPEEDFELAIAALNDSPVQGIEERFDELLVSFLADDWTDELHASLLEKFAQYGIAPTIRETVTVEQQNWNEQWEQSLTPVVVNERITITPEWHRDSVVAPCVIIINPKMSFGTGYHPTTRMTTGFLEKYVTDGSRWIDAGTGTGVLAIAATMFGASSVFAFDNDVWSVENAIENIERNDVQGIISISQADVFTVALPKFDGIVANLYRNLLLPNMEKFLESVDDNGLLIVSGILKYDAEEIISSATAVGFTFLEQANEEEWVAIVFQKGV